MRPPSFDYLFYHLLQQRLDLADDDRRQLARLYRGYQGEIQLDETLSSRDLSSHALQDLWIPDFTNPSSQTGCQIDALLITSHRLYLLESKHYSGQFHYNGLSSQLNGRPYHFDIETQINRQVLFLRRLLESMNLPLLPVTAYVIFTQPSLLLTNAPNYFLTLAQWEKFLDRLLLEHHFNKRGKTSSYYHSLLNFQYQNPHRPRRLTDLECDLLQTGIHCSHCGKNNLSLTRYKCHCLNCGHTENKAYAYLRTLYEYAVLQYHRPVTRHGIAAFLGKNRNDQLVTKLLSNYASTSERGTNAHHEILAPHLKYHSLLEHPDEKIRIH